jgi:hypothetical protein
MTGLLLSPEKSIFLRVCRGNTITAIPEDPGTAFPRMIYECVRIGGGNSHTQKPSLVWLKAGGLYTLEKP